MKGEEEIKKKKMKRNGTAIITKKKKELFHRSIHRLHGGSSVDNNWKQLNSRKPTTRKNPKKRKETKKKMKFVDFISMITLSFLAVFFSSWVIY